MNRPKSPRQRQPHLRPPSPPLDPAAIERLALHYVGRYATTRAKLSAYLARKLRERGWADAADDGASRAEPAIAAVVARIAALGYVDDRSFAEMRGAALGRRGFGARRVGEALRAAGIEADDAAPALADAAAAAWASAEAFARRRRIGPFGNGGDDADRRRRAFAAMMRAGHAPAIAKAFVDAPPGMVPSAPD